MEVHESSIRIHDRTNKTFRNHFDAAVGIGYRPKTSRELYLSCWKRHTMRRSHSKIGHYKIIDNAHIEFSDSGVVFNFVEPAHDVHVSGKRHFSNVLRLNIAHGQQGKPLPVATKLRIKQHDDFPPTGLPESLVILSINGLRLRRLASEVMSLEWLHSLDLRDNELTELPPQLGQLSLEKLILSNNYLGGQPPSAWSWLDGAPLQQSLGWLSLGSNGLDYFPLGLLKLRNLLNLELDRNKLTSIPFAVERMHNL